MPEIPPNVLLAAGAVVVLVVVLLVLRGLMRRKPDAAPTRNPLAISLNELNGDGPGAGGLQIYGNPVRLACVVLAPAGRATQLPSDEDVPRLLDRVVPGMQQVFNADRPKLMRWPPQLSVQGFAQIFGQQAKLPGDSGKGTPWCGTAGRVEADGSKYLIGLIMRGSGPINVGQVIVERESQWPDILRVNSR